MKSKSNKVAFLATFFDTEKGALECVRYRKKVWKRDFVVVQNQQGFLVISEAALKNAGLLPKRKRGISVKSLDQKTKRKK